MIRHIRFHGRGGEGVKLASHIVSRTAFLRGFTVQDSPLYGAERRGAPVAAFTRYSDAPIFERGYIETPDAVVVMDASLLDHRDAGVLEGVDATTLVLVNTSAADDDVRRRYQIAGRVVTVDVSSIALELLQQHVLSAPIAGLTVKATKLAPWEMLADAVRIELAEIGLGTDSVQRNLVATRVAFDTAADVGLADARRPASGAPASPFVVPHLPPRLARPLIDVPANSALRTTDGWRVYRPQIHLQECSRCFLCFALCPEGAIGLDGDNYPEVDYQHCKGCLVCVSECPTKAITAEREGAI
jgi:pyruvate ferredoxin oxidoreductase gamma subunit